MSFVNEETNFDLSELFFSRTNERGMILYGNSVFIKISGFDWENLKNQPHNIIRHPDMPKAVFKVLWDKLKKSEPVGAYVKNKSKDGKYYWVFALVLPIQDGYLSVRLKPTSKFLPVIQSLYPQIREKETIDKITVDHSVGLILENLKKLNFKSYEDFMIEALLTEIDSRQEKLKSAKNDTIQLLKTIATSAANVKSETDIVLSAYRQSKFVPLNLEIQSFKVEGGAGQSMGVVANQYQKMVSEIESALTKFRNSMDAISDIINTNQFIFCASTLLKEVYDFFKNENQNSNSSHELNHEGEHLLKLIEDYRTKTSNSLIEMIKSLENFESVCNSMRSAAIGLEIVRLTGKMETSRLNNQKSSLDGLIDQLGKFRQILMLAFGKIDTSIRTMKDLTRSLN